jgi:hypothetical protein
MTFKNTIMKRDTGFSGVSLVDDAVHGGKHDASPPNHNAVSDPDGLFSSMNREVLGADAAS